MCLVVVFGALIRWEVHVDGATQVHMSSRRTLYTKDEKAGKKLWKAIELTGLKRDFSVCPLPRVLMCLHRHLSQHLRQQSND